MNNEKIIRLEGIIEHLKTKLHNGEERITENDKLSCSEMIIYLTMAKNITKVILNQYHITTILFKSITTIIILIAHTWNMIYIFERSKYTLDEVNNFTLEECDKLFKKRECDSLFSVGELIWHINNDCLPPMETLYLKQC